MAAFYLVNGFVATLPQDWLDRADLNSDGVVSLEEAIAIRTAATDQFPSPPFSSGDPGYVVVNSVTPRYGPVGSLVTIQGANFRPGLTTVRLNGREMPIVDLQTSSTWSRVVVVVPVGATSGHIVVQVGTLVPSLGSPFVVGNPPVVQWPEPPLSFGQLGFGEAEWVSQGSGRSVRVLAVAIRGRGDSTNVGTAQFYVYFDPTIFQCTGVGPGRNSPLGSANTSYCIDNFVGGVSVVRISDRAPVPPAGGDVTFEVGVLYFKLLQMDVTTANLFGISLVFSEASIPAASIGNRARPEFMQSRRVRF
jgi:hypothetical protein